MWEPSRTSGNADLNRDGVLRWDQLIEGMRWYRGGPYKDDKYFVYVMDLEDAAAVKAKTEEDLSDFVVPYGTWNPASWWANSTNFPASHIFWRDELAQEQATQSATLPDEVDRLQPESSPEPEPQPETDSEPESESEEDIPPPVVAQPGQGNVGQRLADPTITSDGAAQYAPRGAYACLLRL